MKLSEEELKLLKELTSLYGPSGDEAEVKEYLRKTYNELGYEILEDNLGSIIALKKSKKENAKRVLVLSHQDEVGFMVSKILNNGSVMMMPVGGFNPQIILSSRVTLKTISGKKIKGSVNSVPPHLLRGGSDHITQIEEMVVDFGFKSYEEAFNAGVRIGSSLIIDGNFEELNNGERLLSKAFDDRAGLALGIEALKALKDVDLDYDLYIGGSVQEEVGLRSSTTVANLVKPDLAIIIDISAATDVNGDMSRTGHLGEGVLIRVLDGNMIAFRDLINYQVDCLDRAGAKYQYFVTYGGTDAGGVHKSGIGIKTMTFCICARSIHTPSTILDSEDYLNAKKGLIFMLKDLSKGGIL